MTNLRKTIAVVVAMAMIFSKKNTMMTTESFIVSEIIFYQIWSMK